MTKTLLPTVDHNPRLGEIISRYHSYSTIMLNNLRLNDFDMPFIIRQTLIIKQCSVLDLSNNTFEVLELETKSAAHSLTNLFRHNCKLKDLYLG